MILLLLNDVPLGGRWIDHIINADLLVDGGSRQLQSDLCVGKDLTSQIKRFVLILSYLKCSISSRKEFCVLSSLWHR